MTNVSTSVCVNYTPEEMYELVNDVRSYPNYVPMCSQVRLLTFEEISERRFGNWTMGQVDVKAVNPSLLLKYSKTAGLDPFSITGQATMALLTELVATGSITRRAAV